MRPISAKKSPISANLAQNRIEVGGIKIVGYKTCFVPYTWRLTKFAAKAEGAIYYFSSAANKDLFIKDYKKYEPQYGGWCAYAMGATNEKVEIDPETFKILNGKLYLFYHSFTNNTLTKWNKNESVLKNNADKNWSVIFK